MRSLSLLIEPKTPLVIAFRRTDQGFAQETWEDLESAIPLPGIGVELPLREIYEGVDLPEDSD
jgi:hypothetical protein